MRIQSYALWILFIWKAAAGFLISRPGILLHRAWTNEKSWGFLISRTLILLHRAWD